MANAEALRQHVLDNLNRVLPMASSSAFMRYQLDRIECTSQITELAARKLIVRYSDGRLKRSTANNAANIGVGVRQLPTAEALDLVQALFNAPPSIQRPAIGFGAGGANKWSNFRERAREEKSR